MTWLQLALDTIAPIMLCAAVGFVFGRRFRPDPQLISRISLYVMLPSLVFVSMSEAQVETGEIGQITLVVFAVSVLLMFAGWGLTRMDRAMTPTMQGSVIVAILLMNTGNYGLPLVQFSLGDAGLQRAAFIFVLSAIVTNTLGIYAASLGNATLMQGLRNILTNPLPYATIAGILVNVTGIQTPLFVSRAVGIFAEGSVPILLLLLGVQTSRIALRGNRTWPVRSLLWVSLARLVLTPVLVLVLCALLGVADLTRNVLLLQLSTPTAVTTAVLASEYGNDAEFVSAAILVTTLLSVLTLSVLLVIVIG
jgi:malate permease and related proteins